MKKKYIHHAKKLFNAAWGQILVALITIAGIRLYTELLTIDEFGYVMLSLGGFALLDGLVVMSFSQTLAFYSSRLKNWEEQRSLGAGTYFLLFNLWLLVAPFIVILATALSISMGQSAITAFFLSAATCIYLTSETAKAAMMSLLNVNSEHSKISTWSVVDATTSFIVLSGGLWYGPRNAVTYIYLYVLAKFLSTTLFYFIFFNGKFFTSINKKIVKESKFEIIRYALPFSAMAVVGWLGSYVDRYVLNFLTAPGVVGMYAASTGTISKPYAIMGTIFSNYFRPILFTAVARSEKNKSRKIFYIWFGVSAAGGFFGFLLTYFLGPFLLHIVLAEEYRTGAISIMTVLSIGLTATIVNHSLDNFLFANGLSRPVLIPQVLSIIIGVLAVYILANLYGVVGAAWGKVIGDITKLSLTLLLVLYFQRRNRK